MALDNCVETIDARLDRVALIVRDLDLHDGFAVSERRACQVIDINREVSELGAAVGVEAIHLVCLARSHHLIKESS
jgi:hypothetical protein